VHRRCQGVSERPSGCLGGGKDLFGHLPNTRHCHACALVTVLPLAALLSMIARALKRGIPASSAEGWDDPGGGGRAESTTPQSIYGVPIHSTFSFYTFTQDFFVPVLIDSVLHLNQLNTTNHADLRQDVSTAPARSLSPPKRALTTVSPARRSPSRSSLPTQLTTSSPRFRTRRASHQTSSD